MTRSYLHIGVQRGPEEGGNGGEEDRSAKRPGDRDGVRERRQSRLNLMAVGNVREDRQEVLRERNSRDSAAEELENL